MILEEAIAARYPHQSEIGTAIRNSVVGLCRRIIDAGLLDDNAEQRLCSTDLADFWQQLSEILLADQLMSSGRPIVHRNVGPDFLIEANNSRIWIEVITPEPIGLPADWINHAWGNVVSLPHQDLLLRWTAAIKEKAEKLLGYTDRKTGLYVPGYRDKGTVGQGDAYVIAINSRLLRGFGGAFPELFGISQFPFAVEATFAVGPLQIQIDRESLRAKDAAHSHRPRIRKPNGADVPADTFLDPAFAPISALWAVDVDELLAIGETRPMVVVHNPLAINPLPLEFLPAQSEYEARSHDTYFELHRHNGIRAVI